MGGFNCSDLTGKVLVFRIGSHPLEIVAYKRRLHMEFQLYDKNESFLPY